MDAQFELACTRVADLPPPSLVELAVVGRSNCGKSSLINALTGQRRLAHTSSTPGRTRQLVFFRLRAPDVAPFFLVDLPGYGYAKASKAAQDAWATLVNDYIDTRQTLAALLLLADGRRAPGREERDLLRWGKTRGLHGLILLTKADKLNKSERFGAAQRWKTELGLAKRPLVVSVHDPATVALAREALLALLSASRR